jgi:hypothetical protein
MLDDTLSHPLPQNVYSNSPFCKLVDFPVPQLGLIQIEQHNPTLLQSEQTQPQQSTGHSMPPDKTLEQQHLDAVNSTQPLEWPHQPLSANANDFDPFIGLV